MKKFKVKTEDGEVVVIECDLVKEHIPANGLSGSDLSFFKSDGIKNGNLPNVKEWYEVCEEDERTNGTAKAREFVICYAGPNRAMNSDGHIYSVDHAKERMIFLSEKYTDIKFELREI